MAASAAAKRTLLQKINEEKCHLCQMPKQYSEFDEIEQEVAEKAPAIIYKYRDWSNQYHRSILTETVVWFSHPKDLNDPYDIRVPMRFDFSEIDNPRFFDKLKYHTQIRFPHLHPESRDFRTICENKMDLIKQNPQRHFEENYLEMRESDLYDRIGVFSLSSDALNETMWAHYGNNGNGFCVGFDTVILARSLECGFGFVEYDDEPPIHSFVGDMEENQRDQAYLKHSKWTYESEFRFLKFGIATNKDRSVKFPFNVVKEVILGAKISVEHQREIEGVLKERYGGQVELYRAVPQAGSYGLVRQVLVY